MKSFWFLVHLSFRNLVRQRRRNVILLVAVVIAIAGVLNMNALMRGMLLTTVQSTVQNFVGHLKLQNPEFADNPVLANGFEYQREITAALNSEDVEGIAVRIALPAVIMSERETRGVQLYGIDPANESISVFNRLPIEGESLSTANESGIVIGQALADDLQTAVNRRIVVMAQDEDGNSQEIGFRIKGTYQSHPKSLEKLFVFTGLSYIQQKLHTNRITEVSVLLKDFEQSDPAAATLQAGNPGFEVHTWLSFDPLIATMYQLMGVALYVMTFIIMGSLVFGLTNTFVTAVMERVREFGLLRSVGMHRWQVLVQVLIESTILMLVGIVLGLLLGLLLYLTYSDGIDLSAMAEGMEYAGLSPKFTPSLHLQDAQVVVWLSILLGILASIYPARRAMKMTPLEAIRR